MARILELPEANVHSWRVFSEGLRDLFHEWPADQVERALQDLRPLFMQTYQSGNIALSAPDVEGLLRALNTNISGVVFPLLIEIVRLNLELQQRQGRL